MRNALWLLRIIVRELPGLFSQAGAGHTLRGKYRVYGEGSVRHNGPCDHGLGLEDHPLIMRTDYPSIWHYWRRNIATYWSGVQMYRMGPQFHALQARMQAGLPDDGRELKWPNTPFDRFMKWAFGKPYEIGLPHVEAALRPEDSIYDRD